MVLRCYGGVETRQDTLWMQPLLPLELPQLPFHLTFHGQGVSVHLTIGSIALRLGLGQAKPIRVRVESVERDRGPGDSVYMAPDSRECTVTRH